MTSAIGRVGGVRFFICSGRSLCVEWQNFVLASYRVQCGLIPTTTTPFWVCGAKTITASAKPARPFNVLSHSERVSGTLQFPNKRLILRTKLLISLMRAVAATVHYSSYNGQQQRQISCCQLETYRDSVVVVIRWFVAGGCVVN